MTIRKPGQEVGRRRWQWRTERQELPQPPVATPMALGVEKSRRIKKSGDGSAGGREKAQAQGARVAREGAGEPYTSFVKLY